MPQQRVDDLGRRPSRQLGQLFPILSARPIAVSLDQHLDVDVQRLGLGRHGRPDLVVQRPRLDVQSVSQPPRCLLGKGSHHLDRAEPPLLHLAGERILERLGLQRFGCAADPLVRHCRRRAARHLDGPRGRGMGQPGPQVLPHLRVELEPMYGHERVEVGPPR